MKGPGKKRETGDKRGGSGRLTYSPRLPNSDRIDKRERGQSSGFIHLPHISDEETGAQPGEVSP